ncbi:MAG: hypothetical protein Q7R60_02925 [bacterium]|nr:hypothetical protein [bacterium]
MTPVRRQIVTILIVLAVGILVWVLWPKKKAATPLPVPVPAAVKKMVAKNKKPADAAGLKKKEALDRKVEQLAGEVAGHGRRLDAVETKLAPPPIVPPEPLVEEVTEGSRPLTDGEAERSFAEKLRGEAGRAGTRPPD